MGEIVITSCGRKHPDNDTVVCHLLADHEVAHHGADPSSASGTEVFWVWTDDRDPDSEPPR